MTVTSGITNGELVRNATPAAERGPEHVSEPTDYDAILLAGFGGPEGQDDVIPFLRNVTRGRGIPDERLEEVSHHYRANGGISPINQQNRELKAALEAELGARGIELPVLWGNRNWAPYLTDTLREMIRDGRRRILVLATSAYASYSGCRQYRENLADALAALEQEGLALPEIDKLRHYFNHPGFVEPMVDGVLRSLADLPQQQRIPTVNSALAGFRNELKRDSAERRLIHVREAGKHMAAVLAVKPHYTSPIQMLMRGTLGSERRSRLMQQIAGSGPAAARG